MDRTVQNPGHSKGPLWGGAEAGSHQVPNMVFLNEGGHVSGHMQAKASVELSQD